MGVKSEKTFEEIVERIVALFKPAPLEITPAPKVTEEPIADTDSLRPQSIRRNSPDDNTR